MIGHNVEKCYKLYGYPPGHKLHGKSKTFSAAATHSRILPEGDIEDASTETVALTKSQYHQLLTLLHPKEANSAMASFSVAQSSPSPSSNIVSSSCIYVSYQVQLPNGEVALVTHIGVVRLSEHLGPNSTIAADGSRFFLTIVDDFSRTTWSKADYSLFTQETHGIFIVLLVYVDDIIVANNDLNSVNDLKTFLHSKFKIKDLDSLRYFLGIEIARSAKGIHLCKRKYTLDILADSGTLGSTSTKVPMDQNLKLTKSTDTPLSDPSIYRKLIGCLLYLTISQLDISFSVQTLSQFMAQSTDAHMLAAQKVLRYLKGAPGQGLLFPSSSSFQLEAYYDLDWASCPDTRQSVTGYYIFLGSSLIS
ncbi:hypothetical protein F2P56_017100 [Juglans regia]|uniref:Reverse transcriptase Ty1/copia-type domain-containing protein n=1 Tax=Juglans regia TaxID=51240 RepID=A0A834CVV8_JUGRE|nr:hypothetical protein F2P56_017100 [Juglans regia]